MDFIHCFRLQRLSFFCFEFRSLLVRECLQGIWIMYLTLHQRKKFSLVDKTAATLIRLCFQADCFYFNILPFAEDMRDYVFASFNDLPAPQQPTSVQQEAADALVQMMDLAPPSLEEMLRPERTVNPVLQVCFICCSLCRNVSHPVGLFSTI